MSDVIHRRLIPISERRRALQAISLSAFAFGLAACGEPTLPVQPRTPNPATLPLGDNRTSVTTADILRALPGARKGTTVTLKHTEMPFVNDPLIQGQINALTNTTQADRLLKAYIGNPQSPSLSITYFLADTISQQPVNRPTAINGKQGSIIQIVPSVPEGSLNQTTFQTLLTNYKSYLDIMQADDKQNPGYLNPMAQRGLLVIHPEGTPYDRQYMPQLERITQYQVTIGGNNYAFAIDEVQSQTSFKGSVFAGQAAYVLGSGFPLSYDQSHVQHSIATETLNIVTIPQATVTNFELRLQYETQNNSLARAIMAAIDGFSYQDYQKKIKEANTQKITVDGTPITIETVSNDLYTKLQKDFVNGDFVLPK